MGCSGEKPEGEIEPDVIGGTAIAFSAKDGERTVTRTGLEEVGQNSFRVWAYKNMSSDNVGNSYGDKQQVIPGYYVRWFSNSAYSSTSNTSGWEYVNQQIPGELEQTIKYWDWSAKAYRFFGMAGGSESAYTVSEANENNVVVTIHVNVTTDQDAENMPYYSHLWFSNGNIGEKQKEFGKPVTLEFLKPLTKVRFMFIFEDPEDEPYTTLGSISFGPTDEDIRIYQKGTIRVTYPLTGTGKEEQVSITPQGTGWQALYQDYNEKPDNLEPRKWYTVLPALAQDQGTYTLTVSVNGLKKSVVVPAEFMNWLPGYQYTYIFKVHVDGGVSIDSVQSAFTPWTPVTIKPDYKVYNW